MLGFLNKKPSSSCNLVDRLRALGECASTLEWVTDESYYKKSLVTSSDTPELIELAINVDYFLSEDEDYYWLPVHAWRLLGRIGAVEAIQPLIGCFNTHFDDEWCQDELPEVFSLIGKDALIPLSTFLTNKSQTDRGYYLAIESMTYIAMRDETQEKYVIDIFTNILDDTNEESAYLNTLIVMRLIEFNAEHKMQYIAKAVKRDMVETWFTGDIETIEINMGIRPEPITIYPTDDGFFLPSSQIDQITSLKIGRNDKCSCGSGKKYKKCCLDDDAL